MGSEGDGPVAASLEAARHVAAELQQRQNIREWIHGAFRTIAKIMRTPQHRSSGDECLPTAEPRENDHACFRYRCFGLGWFGGGSGVDSGRPQGAGPRAF